MRDARVDAYVAGAPEFARPVLNHLRELVHKAHGDVVEDMKWSRPTFLAEGRIVCGMAAFKEHCSFGFWGSGMTGALAEAGIQGDDAAGSIGRIAGLEDLPKDKILLGLMRRAFALAGEEGGKLKKPVGKAPKAPLAVPADLAEELEKAGVAAKFAAMSPSCRREYVEWIVEAKRAETRGKRIGETVGWIGEGKKRNWKYEPC